VQHTNAAQNLSDTVPVIEIRDLHKSYGALEVLKGVDLVAPRGHVVSLIGSSGSGKSTLLRCANLLEDSQQGEVLFEGEQIKAHAYLEKVGIGDKCDVWPAQLSGGQQQRAAIARALCMEPKALLFDEPTSALDPELEQEVIKVIKDLAQEGRTMIIVTHDMRLAADVSDHVIFLHQGLVEEEAAPETLFGAPKSERLRQFLSHSQSA